MNVGKLVFAQIMEHLPLTTFRRCVARYGGEHKVKTFSCLDQYLCMAFAQLTYRESVRDLEACLRAQANKLYHMGIHGSIARNTLANANAVRDWRVYADLAQSLIGIARRLYAEEPFGVDLKETVYALDASTIDLCLSVFSWAPFRSAVIREPRFISRLPSPSRRITLLSGRASANPKANEDALPMAPPTGRSSSGWLLSSRQRGVARNTGITTASPRCSWITRIMSICLITLSYPLAIGLPLLHDRRKPLARVQLAAGVLFPFLQFKAGPKLRSRLFKASHYYSVLVGHD